MFQSNAFMQIGNFFKKQEIITYNRMQEGGFFGIACEENNSGVVVKEVIPETAAEKAGVEAGDILLAVNDEPINSREEFIILVSSSLSPVLK